MPLVPDPIPDIPIVPPVVDESAASERRDRLLAALTLIAGVGLAVGLPFALKLGAEFFMPLTAALVVAVALVPVLEWLERRRVPSGLAALFCVLLFLAVLGVVTTGVALSKDNTAADVFYQAAGDFGRRAFGLVLWAAGLSSVIGASFTSISFLTKQGFDQHALLAAIAQLI